MAKSSGLGDNFYIGGYDLSGDISSLDTITGGPAVLDVTPINAYANVRIGGLRAGDLQFTSFFDAAAGAEHLALSTLPRTDVIATYARGAVIGNPGMCISGRQINYDPTRDNTGNLTLKVEVQSDAYGMEWGTQLTAGLRTDTTATTGPAYDNGAGYALGAQAYLQITSLTGTNVDVTVSHATTSGGSYTTLLDFGSQTAIGGFRQTASGTVDEFLKVNTTGTFSSVTFSVVIVVNKVAVVF
jgi:hypothetical protein